MNKARTASDKEVNLVKLVPVKLLDTRYARIIFLWLSRQFEWEHNVGEKYDLTTDEWKLVKEFVGYSSKKGILSS